MSMLYPISGRWMDAKYIGDRAIRGIRMRVYIGSTTKIFVGSVARSTILRTMGIFGFSGSRTPSSGRFCRKTAGQSEMISGLFFRRAYLIEL